MTYREAVDYISGLSETLIKPGLERISQALEVLGDPHRAYPHVLIGGTNGKGSTLTFLGSILDGAGHRAGLFTSPHLVRFEERIRIGGDEISSDELADLVTTLRDTAIPLSYFEFTTAMALLHFAHRGVDLALLEVGLGGRWDATNATDPLLSVITSIALDHQRWLGETIAEVALEKAMISRRGRPLVLGAMDVEAMEVIESAASARAAKILVEGRDFSLTGTMDALTYEGTGRALSGIRLGLDGRFQVHNAACALAAAEILDRNGFALSDGDLRAGLSSAIWPGRYEIRHRPAEIIIDSAHNPSAVMALADSLGDLQPSRWLFSALEDKDARGMAEAIASVGGEVFVAPVRHPKAQSPEQLMAAFRGLAVKPTPFNSVREAMAQALSGAGTSPLVVAGSVVLAGEVLAILDRAEDGGER